VLWTEWNGPYRDTVRDYWRGVAPVGEFATRFAGSADLYERDGRRPFASINFITAHDGFTLADLVSYNDKHNEANLEDNADGTEDNRSWNCGVEGETDDADVLALRARQQRNFLTTLFLSQGVPMLLAGDELGRSQGGNNNAYCQDNEISWLDWDLDEADQQLHAFTRRLIEFRHDHPVVRRETFFGGEPDAQGLPDIWWFRPDGRRMARRDWEVPGGPVGVFLNGDAIRSTTARGEPVHDDSLVLLFNGRHEAVELVLPPRRFGARWHVELSTTGAGDEGREYTARQAVAVAERSVVVLSRRR
jgi:glycogen operon protein